MAGIGRLPATWIDRSIIIALKRKSPAEKVERLTRERKAALQPLARMAARWAADNAKTLENADPVMPDFSSDRATEIGGPCSLSPMLQAVPGPSALVRLQST